MLQAKNWFSTNGEQAVTFWLFFKLLFKKCGYFYSNMALLQAYFVFVLFSHQCYKNLKGIFFFCENVLNLKALYFEWNFFFRTKIKFKCFFCLNLFEPDAMDKENREKAERGRRFEAERKKNNFLKKRNKSSHGGEVG